MSKLKLKRMTIKPLVLETPSARPAAITLSWGCPTTSATCETQEVIERR
jgi:hypothetical protein